MGRIGEVARFEEPGPEGECNLNTRRDGSRFTGAPHVPTFRLSSGAAVGLPAGSAWLVPIA